jgi:hypothetical protein
MTAISDYFRTALLIDDRVEPDYRAPEELDSDKASTPDAEPEPGLEVPPEEDETPVRPSSLVSAFLNEDVVCSVVEPSAESSDIVEMALCGARIADLLILDWLLFGNASATVDAIREISEQNKSRLRVIVVFTGAHSLSDVAGRLVEDVGFEGDDFVLRRGNTVVLVFGKPGPPLTGGEDRRQPSSDYRDLPRMIRDDLEMVFKGLMPELAFRGISTLRESVPRILATFNSDLDAAALVHRALLPEPADAGPQFVRLLASDLEQALHDERVGEIWDPESVRTYCEHTPPSGSPAQLAQKLRSNQDVRNQGVLKDLESADDLKLVREAISNGLSGVGMADSAVRRAVSDLAVAVGDAAAHESLAVLMSSTSLGETPPRLELGVVLRSADGHYWLCIQPLCDSVRLEGVRAFPLLPLTLKPSRPAAMIRTPEGDAIRIGFESSPHRLAMPEFSPTHERAVIAGGDPSNWHFTSNDGSRYRAITRLRPEVAAQAAHGLASAASRAGADVSEWMRQGAPQASVADNARSGIGS